MLLRHRGDELLLLRHRGVISAIVLQLSYTDIGNLTGVRNVLMVKILNTCILSILVYNLFYRQIAQYFIYAAVFSYTGILAVFMK